MASKNETTPPDKVETKVCQWRLSGHRDEVTCLALDNEDRLLASGGSEGVVRLWDFRRSAAIAAAVRSEKCVAGSGGTRDGIESVPTSVCFNKKDSGTLFVSQGMSVFEYDIRVPSVVLRKASARYGFASSTKAPEEDDEINQITCDPSGKLLAACSDSGQCVVFDIEKKTMSEDRSRQPNYEHSNVCTAIEWRPDSSDSGRRQFVSGGMDAMISGWNYNAKKKFRDVAMTVNASADERSAASGSQLFNPPFVYSLSFSPDGRYFAAGLGDSTVSVHDADAMQQDDGRKCPRPSVIARFGGHSAVVGQVRFARFGVDRDDTYALVSASNDTSLLFRRITIRANPLLDDEARAEEEAAQRAAESMTAESVSTDRRRRRRRRRRGRKKKGKTTAEPLPPLVAEQEIVLRINHGTKMNWLCTTADGHVCVADTESDIHVYSGLA
eukprot:g2084.t1